MQSETEFPRTRPPNTALGSNAAPEVSVGMPVYNGERYLRDAVASILAQTFTDFELIISDNASTDSTATICDELASTDFRIKYIRQPKNIGAVRNFDYVAAAAKGRYLKWAAANDICHPSMLASCVEVLRREKDVAVCYGRTCLIDGVGREIGPYQYDLSLEQDRPSERFIELRSRMNLNNAQHGVIRVDLLRQTRQQRLYRDGDLIFMAELALYGKFRRLPDVLFYRRMDEGAASRFLSDKELQYFLNPSSKRSRFNAWRRTFDCVWSVLRSPISGGEKKAALNFVARSAFWDRRDLWNDLFRRKH
jgi:glycosyltransferase involved in cell wall biosynthesis